MPDECCEMCGLEVLSSQNHEGDTQRTTKGTLNDPYDEGRVM